MSTPAPQIHDTLVIDPVRMNIVNRVAEGCALDGHLQYHGGLLLQGSLRGQGQVGGRLVVWHSGQLQGQFRVLGDLYVLGHVGAAQDGVDDQTRIECHGTVYLASTAVCTGHLRATRLHVYDGAALHGPFTTLRPDQALPTLTPQAS